MNHLAMRIGARVISGCCVAGAAVVFIAGSSGAVTAPKLRMTKGALHSLQTISISVGPNHLFKPYLHINILECADPGGTKQHLPKSVASCDGNTIQGNTVLIGANGSFKESGYELFTLPNFVELGENPGTKPVCNRKNACVLYIGENQLNFTWPKMFSSPFYLSPAKKK